MADLTALRSDPVAFLRLCGFDPAPWQQAALKALADKKPRPIDRKAAQRAELRYWASMYNELR